MGRWGDLSWRFFACGQIKCCPCVQLDALQLRHWPQSKICTETKRNWQMDRWWGRMWKENCVKTKKESQGRRGWHKDWKTSAAHFPVNHFCASSLVGQRIYPPKFNRCTLLFTSGAQVVLSHNLPHIWRTLGPKLSNRQKKKHFYRVLKLSDRLWVESNFRQQWFSYVSL